MIKVWDYLKEYEELRDEILEAVDSVFKGGTLVFGPRIKEFEKQFSSYCDSGYGIGVGNCTDALCIALRALDIGSGDEVITVSNTAVPTVTAIVSVGATPVFVDIDEYSLIDVSKIEEKITKKTKAIVPVHLFGQSCDMDAINEIARTHGFKVIEDCAQSHGALYKGKKTGSLGDVGCFSFYPTKIFGAYGDGGFITTNNEALYDKMNRLRFFGMERKEMSSGHWNGKYYAVEYGPNTTNSRLDEVHAAILLKKLVHIERWIERRREIAKKYKEELTTTKLDLPKEVSWNRHAYYVYVVAHPARDSILKELAEKDIHLNISYPWPVHLMEGYRYLGWKEGDLPVTEKRANLIFSLPMYPTLTNEEQDIVIKTLKEIL
jgi:dTDP-3-amino-2,3,6-trideoxy-4-keto-D-glucose/dTDP-3-amino-3,4,6-trideoxy-alpha-D-glucose/dTDP-2,6-dideoxy-D-kanosamine transaminase